MSNSRRRRRTSKDKESSSLYGCLIWIALAVFFLPLVLIPMWIYKRDWSTKKKVIISVILVLCWGLLIGIAYSGEEQAVDPVTVQDATPLPEIESQAEVSAPTPEPTLAPTVVPTPIVTPTPAPSPVPVLKKGEKGEQVKQIQERLIELAYLNASADGDFGPATQQAVKEFQSRNGLHADGIAGQQTIELMFSSAAKKQEWVWIPAEHPSEGKEKYHTRSDCSGMSKPRKVTISEAIQKGFDNCGKCAGRL